PDSERLISGSDPVPVFLLSSRPSFLPAPRKSTVIPLLKFRPVLHSKPWGGDALWRTLGKGAPGDDRMGESWELSDRPEGMTTVADGPWAGRTLRDLLEAHGAAILGDLWRGGPTRGPASGDASVPTADASF